MSFHVGDRVTVLREILRMKGCERVVYAKENEEGEIVEIFKPVPTGFGEKKPPYAKVLMNKTSGVKTFRLTSLKRT